MTSTSGSAAHTAPASQTRAVPNGRRNAPSRAIPDTACVRTVGTRGSRLREVGDHSFDDADGQRAITARVEDVAPDPRKDSLRRLEVEPPLEEVRRPAMLCRELREPPGVAAGPIQSLILEGERLV